jgi:hypothetical protein
MTTMMTIIPMTTSIPTITWNFSQSSLSGGKGLICKESFIQSTPTTDSSKADEGQTSIRVRLIVDEALPYSSPVESAAIVTESGTSPLFIVPAMRVIRRKPCEWFDGRGLATCELQRIAEGWIAVIAKVESRRSVVYRRRCPPNDDVGEGIARDIYVSQSHVGGNVETLEIAVIAVEVDQVGTS